MPPLSFPPCSEILNGFRPFSSFGFTVPNRKIPCLAPVLAFLLLAATPVYALAATHVVNIPNGIYAGGAAYGNSSDNSGTNSSGPADNNQLNILSGGTVTGSAYGGYVNNSNYVSAAVTDNSVTVSSGGSVGGEVRGGYASSNLGDATATGNSVTIGGGSAGSYVRGGHANSESGDATARGNSVTISGGSVRGNVYGGYANSTGSYATATGNSVTISGGSVDGNVYGGQALSGTSATATGNSVTISGSPVFGATSGLYGGSTAGAGAVDAFSSNRLNVLNYSGSAVASVQNFQYFNFLLPAGFGAGDTALTATGTITLGNGVTGSTVERVDFMGGGNALRPGDSINLLAAGGGVAGTLENDGQSLSGKKGAALLYDLQLHQGANAVTATVLGVQANPQMKALSEGYLSGSALINQGSDLIAGQGMNEAVRSAKAARAGISGNYGIGVFGALSGGYSRYNTGSHVDMGSMSLLTGLSWGADLTPGRLTLGAFFEYGNGSYDTYNSFSNAASVHGDGDIYHIGGGVLGRMDFINTGPGHIYAEGSFRAGGVHNEYSNNDLRDNLGNRAGSHSTSAAYYGIHLGTGYLWNITDKASLDLYGKYFWTRQDGDSITLNTGDPVTFKAVDSHRLRLGGRFAYAINEYVSPYIGAAYEHEFDGQARATTYGYDIKAPSLRGDTGMAELGLTLKPSQTLPLSFDLGVQGYVGKREGVTGSLQVKFEF